MIRPFYLSGGPTLGEGSFEVRSPFDGSLVAEVSRPTAAQAEQAVADLDAVRAEAQALTPHVRAAALDHIIRRLAERTDEIAALITAENGKPMMWARSEVGRAVSTFRWAAEEARRFAGDLMIGFGLVSALVGAFFLFGRRDIKRMFAYSSIEHMGLITFAFGLGGPIANFAGLLHMTAHSLIKSGIFFAAGHASQQAGSQQMDRIRGLIRVNPTVGWGLMLGSLAILGMPPFGIFASEFLILTTAMRELPWATPFLLLALGVAFAAILQRVQPMVFGDTSVEPLAHPPALVPVFVHLGLGLMLGLYIPPYLNQWYRQAASLLGGVP